MLGITSKAPFKAILLVGFLILNTGVDSRGLERDLNQKCGRMTDLPSVANCSTSLVSQSIIGGLRSKTTSWPWRVLLPVEKGGICGGSLIAPNIVMTAAHCIKAIFQTPNPMAYLNIDSYEQINSSKNYWSSPIQAHGLDDMYNNKTRENDIALITLKNPVPSTYEKLCLPDKDEPLPDGKDCYVAGYGNTKDRATNVIRPLMEVCLPIFPWNKCAALYKYSVGIKDKMFCAGYIGQEKDTCNGDSGSALVCKQGNVWKAFGIVSYGGGLCGWEPGVYTDVRKYIDNIKNYMDNVPKRQCSKRR